MLGWVGVGERELAEDTGLARSAYMSSESALRAELLCDVADDTEDTLLTLKDLGRDGGQWRQPSADGTTEGRGVVRLTTLWEKPGP